MNSTKAKYKFSKLEILVNKSMVIVFILQCILAIVAAVFGTNILNTLNKGNNDGAYYMFYDVKDLGFMAFFGTWILIFTNFVPISLMVTLEVVKLG